MQVKIGGSEEGGEKLMKKNNQNCSMLRLSQTKEMHPLTA